MKSLATIIAIISLSFYCQGQSAIGKQSADGAGILDFKANTTLGIILPYLLSTTNVVTPGTLFYDAITKKIMYRDNTTIQDLSINTGTFTPMVSYNNLIESNNVSVIGSHSSSATGVVILESDTKALILPKVASPHLNISNPEPGTICYDTVKDLLCVYNGTEWTFWGKQ